MTTADMLNVVAIYPETIYSAECTACPWAAWNFLDEQSAVDVAAEHEENEHSSVQEETEEASDEELLQGVSNVFYADFTTPRGTK